MDITCNVLTYVCSVLLPPFSLRLASSSRLASSAPARLRALSFPLCAPLRCPSFLLPCRSSSRLPGRRRFGSRPVLWQTNKHSVSQQSNSAASCFLPEPALKYCNLNHLKLLPISIGSGASGKLRSNHGNNRVAYRTCAVAGNSHTAISGDAPNFRGATNIADAFARNSPPRVSQHGQPNRWCRQVCESYR